MQSQKQPFMRGRARGTPLKLPSSPGEGSSAGNSRVAGQLLEPSKGSRYNTTTFRLNKGCGLEPLGRGMVRSQEIGTTSSKRGTTGIPIQLMSNSFLLVSQWKLYQYAIHFSPEEMCSVTQRKILRGHKDKIGDYIWSGSVLYTSQLLNPSVLNLWTPNKTGEGGVRVTLNFVGEVGTGDHQGLQVLGILFRKCLRHLGLQHVGRNLYEPAAAVHIDYHSVDVWPGYITSVRQFETQVMLCVDVSHKVLPRESVLHVLENCMQKAGDDFRSVFKNSIVGCTVLTDYNYRTYRVDDVDFSVSPTHSFPLSNGKCVSYVQYYREKYNLMIRSLNQPLLVARARLRSSSADATGLIYLVPELCRVTGVSDEMRQDVQTMRALAQHTRISPVSRMEKLHQFSQRLLGNPDVVNCMDKWNLKLSDELVQFDGRVLPRETVLFGDGVQLKTDVDVSWGRKLAGCSMLRSIPLTNWVMIFPDHLKKLSEDFLHCLSKVAVGLKFHIKQPAMLTLDDNRTSSLVDAVEQAVSSQNPQLIMAVLSTQNQHLYTAFKRKCTVDRAVLSQVVTKHVLSSQKNVLSAATNIVIQLNAKLGGTPWTVEVPLSGLMVIGFDVCHKRDRSYGAFVASLDQAVTSYFSTVCLQGSHEEVSNQMGVNMCTALHRYKEKNNGQLPNRIMVYRDGVGIGDLECVKHYEVHAVKEVIENMYGSKKIRLCYIIVTKSSQIRLFHKSNNPFAGTIADDVITNPEQYDFFLVSQSVRQGTVTPTAYCVIHDSVELDADKIQRLTYKLTHLYYNWSGTIRVPAPCQYAHKLAYLVGQIEQAPSHLMEGSLHYL